MSEFETSLRKQSNFPKMLFTYVDDILTVIYKNFKLNIFFQNIYPQCTSIKCIYKKFTFLDILTKRNQKSEMYKKKTDNIFIYIYTFQ